LLTDTVFSTKFKQESTLKRNTLSNKLSTALFLGEIERAFLRGLWHGNFQAEDKGMTGAT
jgi:hypothetical protein